MPTFELRFPDGLETRVEKVQFDARDASKALSVAQAQKGHRPMELWEGGRKLCDLRRAPVSEGAVWIVQGAGRPGLALVAQQDERDVLGANAQPPAPAAHVTPPLAAA